MVMMFTFSSNAQCKCDSSCNTPSKFRPYVSVGTGLSLGVSTHAVEAGIWNNSVWLSGVVEYTPSTKTDSTDYIYSGLKVYKKVYTSSKLDFFVYGATKIGNNTKGICLEPGLCSIYNFTDKLAFQWSFSTPVYEGVPNKTLPLNTSVCINWFF